VTETERIKEKRKTTAWGRTERERKKSRMPGGESHIGRSWELGSVPKNSWRNRKFQGSASARPNHCTLFFPLLASGEAWIDYHSTNPQM